MRGKTISIFIPDSNPRGIKICDIHNSIVRAIFVPRNKLKEFVKDEKRKKLDKPGIYFLFGKDDDGKLRTYVGEAESLFTRIKQQDKDNSKDFWSSVIFFVSEKNNINKAHIKFLESYCYSQIKKINKTELENTSKPTKPKLTEQDEDFAMSFFDDMKILLSTLGFLIFEESKKETSNVFYCKGKDADAKGEYSEDGMVVFEGSRATLSAAPSFTEGNKRLRSSLVEKKVLRKENDCYKFAVDYTFNSPSTAARIILGRSSNGWDEWKDEGGKTLDISLRPK